MKLDLEFLVAYLHHPPNLKKSMKSALTVIHLAILLKHDSQVPLGELIWVVANDDLALKILFTPLERHPCLKKHRFTNNVVIGAGSLAS